MNSEASPSESDDSDEEDHSHSKSPTTVITTHVDTDSDCLSPFKDESEKSKSDVSAYTISSEHSVEVIKVEKPRKRSIFSMSSSTGEASDFTKDLPKKKSPGKLYKNRTKIDQQYRKKGRQIKQTNRVENNTQNTKKHRKKGNLNLEKTVTNAPFTLPAVCSS